MSSNSEAVAARIAELRRKITADKGKIERRETAVLFARRDIREAADRIRTNQNLIEELGGKVRR